MGNLYAPDIEYQYTVMRKERYVNVWESTDIWGECDSICSGTYCLPYSLGTYLLYRMILLKSLPRHLGEQTRIYSCVEKETGKETPGRCSEQDEPQPPKRPCNLHCTIK